MSSRNIVAGATRALGFALVQGLADDGANVVTVAITANRRFLGWIEADEGRSLNTT